MNKSLATSGNYRNFRIDPNNGERYAHIINPLTGQEFDVENTSASRTSFSNRSRPGRVNQFNLNVPSARLAPYAKSDSHCEFHFREGPFTDRFS